ncbi:MAG: hypothetical protein GX306_08065 [Clostridiales bacterium]|jgi:hypothetical protein|nr:hypothetical protein [Clostridiales bacterium]
MERPGKKFLLIATLICIFLLTGCDKVRFNTYKASEENSKENTIEESKEQQEKEKDATKKEDKNTKDTKKDNSMNVTPTPSVIKPTANIELLIYTINPESGEIEAATAMISDSNELTPELIVSKVVESMADKSIKVGIDKVTTENDAVIVSFLSDQPPLTNVGAGIESAILNSIAQSLMDNLPEYNKVIYRVEGEAYRSEHIDLGIDEAYLE